MVFHGVDVIFKRGKEVVCTPCVISRGIMRRTSVIALKKEIARLLRFVKRWEENARLVRVLNAAVPMDPVVDAEDLQYHLDQVKMWQDALTARVLQLAGIHSGFGILTTGDGAFDADLVALSPAAVLY